MTNFTAEQIIKINEIFSRVVDCKGNLKVFGGFHWDEQSKRYESNTKDEQTVILYGNKTDKNIKTFNQTSDNTLENKFSYYYKHTNDQNFNSNVVFGLCSKSNIADFNQEEIKGLIEHNFKINDISNDDNINTQFSILLYRFKSLQKIDFEILYTAFYDLLKLCGFDILSNKVNINILYKNIFQKVIEVFTGKGVDLYCNKEPNKSPEKIDDALTKKLKECYEINKLFCKVKSNQNLDDLNVDEKLIFKKYGYLVKVAVFTASIETWSKNMIFYGAPGTGKTKFVKDCLDILDTNRARTEWVQFHSGFEYEDFIDGIKPIGIQNGNLNLALTKGVFKEFCLKAAQNEKENFFFIVDEINRADIAAVFGETLSLLEENYRGKSSAIKIKNSALMEDIIVSDASKKSLCIDYGNLQTKFYIPANIYFIGMMNDVDKSIDCFDLALRRRFTWVLMECDYETLNNIEANNKGYKEKCKNLNKHIVSSENNGLNLGRAYEIGHSYFLKKETMSEQQIWDRHIEPILREYIRTQFGDGEVEKKLKMAKKIFVG